MRASDGFFEGVGGLRLYYRTWEVQRARCALAVVHGLGEHSGRWDAFAQQIAVHGYSTYALDLRGHGLSEGRRGHVHRFEYFLQDLDRFRREILGLMDVGCPLFLLGHSMGGLIALRYLEEFDAPLRGGIMVSPWLETRMPVTRWKSTVGHALNRILPALPFESGLQPSHLSHDPAIVQAYRDDPLVHARITPRLFAEASQAMGLVFQRSERIHVPLFLLLAGDDRIVSTQRSQAFARSLAAKTVAVRVYANAYHEVLNEPVRAESLRDLRDWVAARLAASMPKRQHIPASALHDWDSNYAGKGYGGGN